MTVIELIVAAWCLGVLVSDLANRRIPNFLSFGAFVLAIAYLLITGHSVLGASWQSALLGAALGLLFTLPGYIAGQLGAGDVKFLLAIGLIGGWYITLVTFIVGALVAGAAGIAYLILLRYGRSSISAKKWLPFGSALSFGFLLAIGAGK